MIPAIRPWSRRFSDGFPSARAAAIATAMTAACGVAFAVDPEASGRAFDSIAAAHAAAGDAAWERCWLGLARERWQLAAEEAERESLPAVAGDARDRLGMLAAFERGADRVPAGTDRSLPDVSSRLRIRWQAPLDADAIEPMFARGLVLWNDGSAVHAVRLSDGLPPWRTARGPADSLLFPRGSSLVRSASRPARQRPLAMAVAGASALAIIDGLAGTDAAVGPAPLLVCLDISPSAEGRLAWLAAPPMLGEGDALPRPTVFDGPPAADHEIAAVVVRTREPSDWLSLAAFDSRDGRLLWTRPLGPATAPDGIDHAASRRSICLAEDRIVAATQAGLIAAFDRDGRPAWRSKIDGAGNAAPKRTFAAGSAAPVFCRGRILFAPLDRGGLLALDARSGRLLWDRPGLGAATILGAPPGHVIAATVAETGAAIVSLDIEDGSQRARFPTAGSRFSPAGNALLVAGRVLWPAAAKPKPASIHLLDAATLLEKANADGFLPGLPLPPDAIMHLVPGPDALAIAVDRRLFCMENIPPATAPAQSQLQQP